MAYLIFSTLKGRELARQSLRATVVVGRAPECDVCVHDILLSRRHCQFEPHGTGWVLTDLASKNGTFLNEQEVGRHVLDDGETIHIGKTAVKYCVGVLDRSSRGGSAYYKANKTRSRPADPWTALHDTMSGFDYVKSMAERKKLRVSGRPKIAGEMPVMVDMSRFPTPQPTPPDPNAYKSEDIYSLLTELASSSWDSIYMNASRPVTRTAPKPIVLGNRHPRRRHASPVDLSMPANPGPGLLAQPQLQRPANPNSRPPRKWRRALLGMARGFATVGQSVVVLGIVHLLGKM